VSAGCPFCRRLAGGEVVAGSVHAVAFPDAFPVAEGHTLVCPRRHVASVFDLDSSEWGDLWALLREVRHRLADRYPAEGWNIGVNVGATAGQTVEHAHVHLIPRRAGDVTDPRGGVRWVLPERADYWSGRG
jgi:diadenosine tetraphosphate (Ap4A) HIT family hydrolase